MVCVHRGRLRCQCRPVVHRDARGPRAGDRGADARALDRLALPELRRGALVGAAPAEPAWPARRAAPVDRVRRRDRDRRDRPARLRALDPAPATRRPALRSDPAGPDDRGGRARSRAWLVARPRRRGRRRDARGSARHGFALPACNRLAREPASPARARSRPRHTWTRGRRDAGDRDLDLERRDRAASPRARPACTAQPHRGAAVLREPRPRPAGGRRLPRRPDRAGQGRADRPLAPARRLPLRRPDRNGKDGDREGVQRIPLRLRRPARPTRHERVPDIGEPRAAARRRREGRRGGGADRLRPQAAVLRPPLGRVREGAHEHLGRLPAGLRRRTPDRSKRAHRSISVTA